MKRQEIRTENTRKMCDKCANETNRGITADENFSRGIAKKPTREQKELIALNNLRPDNWMVISDNSAEMQIISKRSAQRRTIEKKRR